jgi:cytosine/adenosine deaminase-related metal-dependent hydrolase
LRSLEYAQRLKTRSRNVLAAAEGESTGRTLFDSAVTGGTQALGQPTLGIQPGAGADLVSLDADHPSLFGRKGNAILDSWIFAGARIDCVWRGGCKLVQQGKHFARDEIANRYRRAVESVLE